MQSAHKSCKVLFWSPEKFPQQEQEKICKQTKHFHNTLVGDLKNLEDSRFVWRPEKKIFIQEAAFWWKNRAKEMAAASKTVWCHKRLMSRLMRTSVSSLNLRPHADGLCPVARSQTVIHSCHHKSCRLQVVVSCIEHTTDGSSYFHSLNISLWAA